MGLWIFAHQEARKLQLKGVLPTLRRVPPMEPLCPPQRSWQEGGWSRGRRKYLGLGSVARLARATGVGTDRPQAWKQPDGQK